MKEITISQDILDELLKEVAKHNKLKAMSFVNKFYGYNLKDSKAYVELLNES